MHARGPPAAIKRRSIVPNPAIRAFIQAVMLCRTDPAVVKQIKAGDLPGAHIQQCDTGPFALERSGID